MKIALLAGEQSGDLLGEGLARALRDENPSVELIGIGGPKMASASVISFFPMERLQTMGFIEVLWAFPRLLRAFYQIRNRLLREKPEAIVTIDFPDFHLFLARSLRKKGYRGKLIHYVSPSVWAWRKGRIQTLERHYDLLITLFPFEEAVYRGSRLPLSYVGHPLATEIEAPHEMREKLIALFPGSRGSVIERNLPLQLEAAALFLQKHPEYRLAVSVARKELSELVERLISTHDLHLEKESPRNLMRRASAALATSGTVTLECALSGCPTVVTYPVTGVNYLLGRYLFRILLPYYCIVNIIAEKGLFPEFIGPKLEAKPIAEALAEQLNKREKIIEESKELQRALTGSGPRGAARAILHLLASS